MQRAGLIGKNHPKVNKSMQVYKKVCKTIQKYKPVQTILDLEYSICLGFLKKLVPCVNTCTVCLT